MKRIWTAALSGMLVAGGLWTAHPAAAGTFKVTLLDVPGQTTTVPYAINDHDEVSGTYLTGGFTWLNGQFTTIATPGLQLVALNNSGNAAGYSNVQGKYFSLAYDGATGQLTTIPTKQQYSAIASGINADGIIVGSVNTRKYHFGFKFVGHSVFLLRGPTGSLATTAAGISDGGGVVGGTYADAAMMQHGYVYQNKIYTPFDVPGASDTLVYSVSGTGVVGGFYFDGAGEHGFTRTGDVIATFSYPRMPETVVSGVFPNGDVGGWYSAGGLDPHYFSYVTVAGAYHTFSIPGAYSTFINGINTAGSLVGIYFENSGANPRGFIAQCPADQRPCTR